MVALMQLAPKGRAKLLLGPIVMLLLVYALFLAATGLLGTRIPPRSMTDLKMVALQRAIHAYTRLHGRVPNSLNDLPADADGNRPVTIDYWGRPIEMRVERGGLVTLISLGADGRPGGVGQDADMIGTFDPRSSDPWIREPMGHLWIGDPMGHPTTAPCKTLP